MNSSRLRRFLAVPILALITCSSTVLGSRAAPAGPAMRWRQTTRTAHLSARASQGALKNPSTRSVGRAIAARTARTHRSAAPPIPYDEIFPLRRIHPGMVGYGLTTFRGIQIQRFGVRVIDVLRKSYLGHDMILVRLSGGPITERHANLISGMSGSPVYLEGKLAGAVSMGYEWGREPLVMVTPIEYMEDAFNPRLPTVPQLASVPLPGAAPRFIAEAFRDVPIRDNATTHETGEDRWRQILQQNSGESLLDALEQAGDDGASLLSPISVSGLSSGVLAQVNERLRPVGVRAVAGIASAGAPPEANRAKLQPGAIVGAFYCTGDITLGAFGTVTYRHGNRILAFGHPMDMLGPVNYPMTTAYVADVFSSYQSSRLMCEPGRVVGALEQDRPWSIMGVIGHTPKMVPLSIRVSDLGTGRSRTFHVNCVDHPLWTETVVDAASQQAISEVRGFPAAAMADVRLEVEADGLPPIIRTNRYFDYFNPAGMGYSCTAELDHVLEILENNAFGPAHLRSLKLDVQIWPGHEVSRIESVALDRTTAHPGGILNAEVTLHPWKGPDAVKVIRIPIPSDSPNGPATVAISGGLLGPLPSPPIAGGGIMIMLGGTPRTAIDPAPDLKTMVDRFLRTERNNCLVARVVLANASSYNIRGERFYNLPPGIAAVIHSPRATAEIPLVDERRNVFPLPQIVVGAKLLPIIIQRKDETGDSHRGSGATQTGTDAHGLDTSARKHATSVPPSNAAGQNHLDSESDTRLKTEQLSMPRSGPLPGKLQTAGEKTAAAQIGAAPDSPGKPDSSVPDAPEKAEAPVVLKASTIETLKKLRVWDLRTAGDYSDGKGNGAAVNSNGELTLAPRPGEKERLEGTEYIWRIRSSGGRTLLATGSKGEVYSWSSGKLTRVLSVPDPELLSLAIAPDGEAYVGTAPHGAIYRIQPGEPSGPASLKPFFRTGKDDVLALVAGPGGDLYAGTSSGTIFRITPSGEGRVWAKTAESHVCALAVTPSGAILAGTAPTGLVLRIESGGRASTLWETGDTSVSALATLPDGTVFAGTAPGGKILKIAPDGSAETLLATTGSPVQDMAVVRGQLYAVAGSALYRISVTGAVTKLTDPDSADLLTVCPVESEQLLVGTAHLAAVETVDAAGSGTFESATRDAGNVAHWGHLRWEGAVPPGASVSFETRSGGSAIPDESWSSWQRTTAGEDGERILSPAARYVQFRVRLVANPQNASPIVRQIHVSDLPENRPPSVTVSAPTSGAVVNGTVKLEWSGSDPDDDALIYTVLVSRDGGATWQQPDLTRAGKKLEGLLTRTGAEWNTADLPDGDYLIEVSASDRRSNPDGGLSGFSRISLRVANSTPHFQTPTAVTVRPDGRVELAGSVDDGKTAIIAVTYSVDGGPLFEASSNDGMFDSSHARFHLQTDPVAPGDHHLVLHAVNATGRSTTLTLPFSVEKKKE